MWKVTGAKTIKREEWEGGGKGTLEARWGQT